jgi:hypothetical protein
MRHSQSGGSPGNKDHPNPLPGYVMSFAHFHEKGFRIPVRKFF